MSSRGGPSSPEDARAVFLPETPPVKWKLAVVQRSRERTGVGGYGAEAPLPLGGRMGGWAAVETVAMVQSKPSGPEQACKAGVLAQPRRKFERKKAKVPA